MKLLKQLQKKKKVWADWNSILWNRFIQPGLLLFIQLQQCITVSTQIKPKPKKLKLAKSELLKRSNNNNNGKKKKKRKLLYNTASSSSLKQDFIFNQFTSLTSSLNWKTINCCTSWWMAMIITAASKERKGQGV